jgi:hypothetical protein
MTSFVVTGIGKQRIADLVTEAGGPEVSVTVATDFEAAIAIQQGRADYYIGACHSGAGGALGVARAVLGADNVIRLSGMGRGAPGADEVEGAVATGARAFGLAHDHIDLVVPLLVHHITRS